MAAGKSTAQGVGLLFGLFYMALGVIGFFVTGFGTLTAESGDDLLGVGLNPYHNIAHFGIGLFLFIMCTRAPVAAAEGAVMGVGLFFVVAFVIGVTAPDNLTILNIHGEGAAANILHLISGVGLLVIGLMSSGQTQAQMKRRGLA